MTEQRSGRPAGAGGTETISKRSAPWGLAIAIVIAAVAVVAVGLVVGSPPAGPDAEPELRGAVLPAPQPKPDFTLTDTRGRPYDFRAKTDGKLALLFFGFTNCPDVCPVHMANVAAVLRGMPFEQRSRIEMVFVSADPARDSPERIREWLDSFDSRFVGLRGSLEEVNAILAELRLASVVHDEPDENGEYNVGHPAQILAFTPDGMLRVVYPFGLRQADWAHDLPRLLRYTDSPVKASRLEATTAVVPAPVGDGPAALYVSVRNHGDRADALVGAVTRVAGRVELHEQVMDGATMRMQQIHEVVVPAQGGAALEPGGAHVMLRELQRRLVPGDTFTVELGFRHAGSVPVQAVVVEYAELERALAAARSGHGEG